MPALPPLPPAPPAPLVPALPLVAGRETLLYACYAMFGLSLLASLNISSGCRCWPR
ncbi:hypothetical protein H7I00_08245 [Mycobacterium bohemicum]|nr:hypothetical protein [Mycobacterium bohemicum]